MVSRQHSFLTQVELYVQGRKLSDLDTFSKSDPLCIISEYNETTEKWVKLGQTEHIRDDLNPNFRTRFTLNYFYERRQLVKFEMVDVDGDGTFDLIGEVVTELGLIMRAKPDNVWQSTLTMPGKTADRGTIIVRGENVHESHTTTRF